MTELEIHIHTTNMKRTSQLKFIYEFATFIIILENLVCIQQHYARNTLLIFGS